MKRVQTPRAEASPDVDATFAALLAALAEQPGFGKIIAAYRADRKLGNRKRFGQCALKVDGRMFAFPVNTGLVVKLPKARVDALIAAGHAAACDPSGKGRAMKQWAILPAGSPAWLDLVQEAHAFVKAASTAHLS